MIVANSTLWETEDRSRLVPDLDPEARFLFCVPGDELVGAREARYIAHSPPVTKHIEAPVETKQVKAKQTKGGK